MISYTWHGPETSLHNRILIPGKSVLLNPEDALVKKYRELGYLSEHEKPLTEPSSKTVEKTGQPSFPVNPEGAESLNTSPLEKSSKAQKTKVKSPQNPENSEEV
jgi:hypothetical protein